MVDFVKQSPGHRMGMLYGNALAAHFIGESKILKFKDHVLLRNRSGKVGIWNLYSLIYTAPGRFKAVGRLIGYEENYDSKNATDAGRLGRVFDVVEGGAAVPFGAFGKPPLESSAPTTPPVDYIDRRG